MNGVEIGTLPDSLNAKRIESLDHRGRLRPNHNSLNAKRIESEIIQLKVKARYVGLNAKRIERSSPILSKLSKILLVSMQRGLKVLNLAISFIHLTARLNAKRIESFLMNSSCLFLRIRSQCKED